MNFWKKGFWRSCSSICSNGYAGKDDLVQQGICSEITGRDQFTAKTVSTIFPDITADKLPVGSEKEITEISTQFGERIYRVSMQKVFLGESVAPSKLLMDIPRQQPDCNVSL